MAAVGGYTAFIINVATTTAGGRCRLREIGMEESVSQGLAQFIDKLNPDDREKLVSALKDTETYLAEDMDDVIAILNKLSSPS